MLGLILPRQAGPYWFSALGQVSLNIVISRPCWIGSNSVAWMKAMVLALFSGHTHALLFGFDMVLES